MVGFRGAMLTARLFTKCTVIVSQNQIGLHPPNTYPQTWYFTVAGAEPPGCVTMTVSQLLVQFKYPFAAALYGTEVQTIPVSARPCTCSIPEQAWDTYCVPPMDGVG